MSHAALNELAAPASHPGRIADAAALVRPRLAFLGLAVVALSYVIASPVPFDVGRFFAMLMGSALCLFGASALNQSMEAEADARMRRTRERPVPAGRVTVAMAAVYGVTLAAAGLIWLASVERLTVVLAAIGIISYIALYTPLKQRSSLSTVVGAVPGAMPALMGWSAANGSLDLTAWALFWILFLWQMPHFLAVAWMYRVDYARAGFRMLTVDDPGCAATSRQVIGYGLALIPVSLLPTLIGAAGDLYFLGALLLGLAYLASGIGLAYQRSGRAAKRLLRVSVLYLPLLLALLALDAGRG